jgi:hypothetical protein
LEAAPLRRLAIFAVFLAPFISTVPVAAQQTIETCPSVPIIPQQRADMTKRLNDDLDCLWRKVQGLEREVDRLKQEQATKKNGSPPLQSNSNVQEQKPSPSNDTAEEGGVEVSQRGAFLSSDKKTISDISWQKDK